MEYQTAGGGASVSYPDLKHPGGDLQEPALKTQKTDLHSTPGMSVATKGGGGAAAATSTNTTSTRCAVKPAPYPVPMDVLEALERVSARRIRLQQCHVSAGVF